MAKKIGRPTKRTEETVTAICERLASGETLSSICKDPDMPAAGTVIRWTVEDITFRELYARAREAQAEVLVDEIIRIADEADDAQLGRLKVDARKWVASKIMPKKYGDKIDVTSGGEKMPTVNVNVPPLPDGN